MGSLTSAQLDQIAAHLVICQDPATTRLRKPEMLAGDQPLAAKLDTIAQNPNYAHLGIGVIDFSVDVPQLWMQNASDTWRIASTAKIAILLAAIQLRDDVRWLVKQGFIKTGKDGDDLFATKALWQRSKNRVTRRLAKDPRPPRVSTIFDFTVDPPEFIGNPMTKFDDRKQLVQDVADDAKEPDIKNAHMSWEFATSLAFRERLWFACARSDNVAATSCVSEIGVAYIVAVQAAYGLFDVARDMKMVLSSGFIPVDTSTPVDATRPKVKYRSISNGPKVRVLDGMKKTGQKGYPDHESHEAGNVLALMAFMLAWRTGDFISPDDCDFITANLADKTSITTGSDLLNIGQIDVKDPATFEATKIGVLKKKDGEEAYLDCEFAYAEIKNPLGKLARFGVVVTGIRPGSADLTGTQLINQLGSSLYADLVL